MQRLRSFLPVIFFLGTSLALLPACGRKADGTPYGVDPAKLPEGRQKTADASIYKQDMPKGAEMNAVTNGARVGQPVPGASPSPAPATPSR